LQKVFGRESYADETKNSSSLHNDNKLPTCKCLNCDKIVAANKYAPHLEKCMGMGRGSSRIASQRNRSNRGNYVEYDDEDNEDDNWSAKEKTKKKLGNGKNKNKSKNHM